MDKLLDDIKNYLDITWEDEKLDIKLSGMIARGMQEINNKGGEDFDYSVEDEPRSLLFTYVMYEREHALDDFWKNYRESIIGLRIKGKVRRYLAENEETDV